MIIEETEIFKIIDNIVEWIVVILLSAGMIFWLIYFLPSLGNWWNEDNIQENDTGQYIGH